MVGCRASKIGYDWVISIVWFMQPDCTEATSDLYLSDMPICSTLVYTHDSWGPAASGSVLMRHYTLHPACGVRRFYLLIVHGIEALLVGAFLRLHTIYIQVFTPAFPVLLSVYTYVCNVPVEYMPRCSYTRLDNQRWRRRASAGSPQLQDNPPGGYTVLKAF